MANGTHYAGNFYPATSQGILDLQAQLGDAQDRQAVNDACAIGHGLALLGAMVAAELDTLKRGAS